MPLKSGFGVYVTFVPLLTTTPWNGLDHVRDGQDLTALVRRALRVVGEDVDGRRRVVQVDGERVVHAGRGVVDLGDRDGQGRRVAEEVVGAMRGAVVADLGGERVRAVVVGGRRVLDVPSLLTEAGPRAGATAS